MARMDTPSAISPDLLTSLSSEAADCPVMTNTKQALRQRRHLAEAIDPPAFPSQQHRVPTLSTGTEKIFQNFLDLLSGWKHFLGFTT
jgi:hypothetical protein